MQLPVFAELLKNRIIFLSGDIDARLSEYVISALLLLDSEDEQKPISLYISSYGGEIYPGLGIYDCMKMIKAPVSTVCIGPAFSMAAWLLASGEKGKRFATPNSRILIHQPWASTSGTPQDIRIVAENMTRNVEIMNRILAKHTGKSVEEIKNATARDLWLSPEEAKEFGIIDEIIELKKQSSGV